ncbi:hypothetical protein ANO14919_145000 [Xylariales sp. No.14919]|nr:hypothetical protein ANO14919_145000 [Xylariales sp. No.14919]
MDKSRILPALDKKLEKLVVKEERRLAENTGRENRYERLSSNSVKRRDGHAGVQDYYCASAVLF